MKSKMPEDAKLSSKDKLNLNTAIKQTVKLSKFSLRKRITVLKNEWWYWDDIMQSTSTTEISTDENEIEPKLIKDQENDTEEILQLFNKNPTELVHELRIGICKSDPGPGQKQNFSPGSGTTWQTPT
jgi:hypothetical protein